MANQSAVPADEDGEALSTGAQIPSLPPSGPRKLIRPTLPTPSGNRRAYARREDPLSLHSQMAPTPGGHAANSHAEAFYLQKQTHAQTPMVFVLEGGDRVEGVIEWYDNDAIKVRNGSVRSLIYKTAIKYLYKGAEGRP